MTDSNTRPPDPNAKTPNGQEGGLHEEQGQSKRNTIDDFEDRANEAVRKEDLATHRLTIGEILTQLGDAERDDEHSRRYREFLVRLLEEPLKAVGIAPPPTIGGEHRVMVQFRAEPSAVPYYIATDILRAGLFAARLRRLHSCPLQIGPPWSPEDGA